MGKTSKVYSMGLRVCAFTRCMPMTSVQSMYFKSVAESHKYYVILVVLYANLKG